MTKVSKPLRQLLRYRMKGEAEILSVVVNSLRVDSKPVAWNSKNEPTAWRITLLLNEWLFLAIHDATSWHEFSMVEAA